MIEPTDNDPAVGAFAERLAPVPPAFRSRIHEADEMYSYNLGMLRGSKAAAVMLYYLKGWQIAQAIRGVASWYFGGIRNVDSFLDFASGFGRVTRFLVRDLDPAGICVAEIQQAAVEFQRTYFGVGGLVSPPDALDFNPKRSRFVMATSFFSHVPDAPFRAWVKRLLECVEPGGVLAFSTNDVAQLGPRAETSNGFFFLPESETDRLDKTAYGTTYVSESYVRETIRAAGYGALSVSRLPRGLGGLQDLYLVSAAAGPDPRFEGAAYYPWGDADLYETRGGSRLAAAGWVETVDVAPAADKVEFFINDEPAELCSLSSIGPHRSRWSFETDLARMMPDDVLSVRAMAGTRRENFLALATLRTNPPSTGN